MLDSKTAVLLALTLAAAAPGAAQTATLVKDVNQGIQNLSVSPRQITLAQDRIFFTSQSTGFSEVWTSDGTQAGTRRLTEDCTGISSCGEATMIGAFGNGVVLWSADGILWRSDGTRAGTWQLADPASGVRLQRSGVFFGGAFLTQGCSEAEGCELWRTDGTVAGTRLVKDLLPGRDAGDFGGGMAVVGSHVFFAGTDTAGVSKLCVTDGTAAGTHTVAGDQAFSDPAYLTAAGNRVFFLARGSEGTQLWTSDGTATGTRVLTHLPNTLQSGPFPNLGFGFWLEPVGSRLYFIADDIVHGQEIWRSDGTAAGTIRITDFGTPEPFNLYPGPHLLQEVANGRVVFWAGDGIHPDEQLWKSDGDPATTALLQCSGPCPGYDPYEQGLFAAPGGRAVFAAAGSQGPAVWVTDGTQAGTVEVFASCNFCLVQRSLQAWPQGVSFTGVDSSHAQEIWISDGTKAGTKRLTDLPGIAPLPNDTAPEAATDGHKVVFAAAASHGSGLWAADAAGTRLLAAFPADGSTSSPTDLVPFAGRLAWSACADFNREIWGSTAAGTDASPLTAGSEKSCGSEPDRQALTPAGNLLYYLGGIFGTELWRLDGTHPPVQLTTVPVYGSSMTGFQGKLYFSTFSGGPAIWKSDGTPEGTGEAFRPAGSDYSSAISPLTVANGALWFAESNGFPQRFTLWTSDGTQAGTRQIAGPASVGATFATLGTRVYFLGGDGLSTSQLWKSDGTAGGTAPVGGSGADQSMGAELIAWHGLLYFVGLGGLNGGTWTLWRSDGTPSGTLALHEFTREDAAYNPERPGLTGLGDRVYFAANDGTHGRELWSTDGTAAGTVLVKDIAPGAKPSFPAWLTAAGGRLWFAADDGAHGTELWQSDGTGAGTRLAQDVAPGVASSSPRSLTLAGNRLYFTADDGATGREVWSLPVTAPSTCLPSSEHLCLGGVEGRYQVEAAWRTADGAAGRGTAVLLTADTGYFWFFSPTNVEAVVKVLDGTGVNGHVWVFYGALSNVEYSLTVTDTQTGLTRRYFNPQGQFASAGDVYGFGPRGASGANPLPPITTAVASPLALIAEQHGKAATVPCHANAQTLCLNGNRFAVTVAWKDFQGHTGNGTAVPLSGGAGTTGTFWFFNASNVELVVKALDGRPVNNHFWLFYGALSNVEYTLTVTDTQTGTIKKYSNPSGRFASVGDTQAF
jgi:ELWxxDGT repeat protein